MDENEAWLDGVGAIKVVPLSGTASPRRSLTAGHTWVSHIVASTPLVRRASSSAIRSAIWSGAILLVSSAVLRILAFLKTHPAYGVALRPVNSMSRRFTRSLGGNDFAALCFAFNRSVDTNDRVAALVEKLVEPQHQLPRRAGFPLPNCVLGLKDIGQPIVAPAQHLV